MIRLNEILHREFPVGLDIKTQTAAGPEGIQVVIANLFNYRSDVRRERASVAGEVDEYPVMPRMTCYLFEICGGTVLGFRIVVVPPEKMGSGEKRTLEAVAPRMIWTDNVTAVGFGLFDECCTSMNADIMECPDDAVGIFGEE